MAKMGRPPKSETKNKFIGVRLSDEHYTQITKFASNHKLTMTQVVQKALEEYFKVHN